MPITKNPNIFSATFTDVYGIAHEKAQLFIHSFTRNASMSFAENGDVSSESSMVHYQVRFWHDEAAVEAGARTQDVVSKSGQSTFFIQSVAADATKDEIVSLCVAHFKDEVLPKLLEPAAMM